MKTLEQKYGSAHLNLDTRWIEGRDEDLTLKQRYQAWEEVITQEYELKEETARLAKLSPEKARRYEKSIARALEKARDAVEKYLDQAFHEGAAWEEYLAAFHEEFEQINDYTGSKI